MLMKALMFASVKIARALHLNEGGVNDEMFTVCPTRFSAR